MKGLESPEGDYGFAAAKDGLILISDRAIDLREGTSRRFQVRGASARTGPGGQWLQLRADGTFAVIGGKGLPSKSPNEVTFGQYSKSETQSPTRVVPGSSKTVQVLGWREDRVVLTRWPGQGQGTRIQAIDPDTGNAQTLVQAPRRAELWQWAEDLLEAEIAPGVEPPSPIDPRLLVAGGLVVLVCAALAVRGWRRRVYA